MLNTTVKQEYHKDQYFLFSNVVFQYFRNFIPFLIKILEVESLTIINHMTQNSTYQHAKHRITIAFKHKVKDIFVSANQSLTCMHVLV